jgi:hypothetical protein
MPYTYSPSQFRFQYVSEALLVRPINNAGMRMRMVDGPPNDPGVWVNGTSLLRYMGLFTCYGARD